MKFDKGDVIMNMERIKENKDKNFRCTFPGGRTAVSEAASAAYGNCQRREGAAVYCIF